MLPADQIQPYVNLLTWQVVTVLGGLFLTPAFYLLMNRVNEIDAFGVKLKGREAKLIVEDAEEAVKEEIESGVSPSQVLAEAVDDAAQSPRERVKAAMSVWSAVAYIIRDLAVSKNAPLPNANQTKEQIEYLANKGDISASQAKRARELLGIRNTWKANPTRSISPDEFRSFQRRSRILGTQLGQLLQRPVMPLPSGRSDDASPTGGHIH